MKVSPVKSVNSSKVASAKGSSKVISAKGSSKVVSAKGSSKVVSAKGSSNYNLLPLKPYFLKPFSAFDFKCPF